MAMAMSQTSSFPIGYDVGGTTLTTTTKRSNRPKADTKTRDIMHRAKGGIIFSECKEIIFLGIGFSKVNSKKAKKSCFFSEVKTIPLGMISSFRLIHPS